MSDTIDTTQIVTISSATPDSIDEFLDELFPGVTRRVSREDRRAIVLVSTMLALDASLGRFAEKHVGKVEKAWDEE